MEQNLKYIETLPPDYEIIYHTGDEIIMICCHHSYLLGLFQYFENTVCFTIQYNSCFSRCLDIFQQWSKWKIHLVNQINFDDGIRFSIYSIILVQLHMFISGHKWVARIKQKAQILGAGRAQLLISEVEIT